MDNFCVLVCIDLYRRQREFRYRLFFQATIRRKRPHDEASAQRRAVCRPLPEAA